MQDGYLFISANGEAFAMALAIREI